MHKGKTTSLFSYFHQIYTLLIFNLYCTQFVATTFMLNLWDKRNSATNHAREVLQHLLFFLSTNSLLGWQALTWLLYSSRCDTQCVDVQSLHCPFYQLDKHLSLLCCKQLASLYIVTALLSTHMRTCSLPKLGLRYLGFGGKFGIDFGF